jgi:hypothetical protein
MSPFAAVHLQGAARRAEQYLIRQTGRLCGCLIAAASINQDDFMTALAQSLKLQQPGMDHCRFIQDRHYKGYIRSHDS